MTYHVNETDSELAVERAQEVFFEEHDKRYYSKIAICKTRIIMIIDKIIIHCSDTPNGRDNNAEDIHRYHLEKGWSGIGYNHVIRIDGSIENGRPHYWIGSHARGHNATSLGICLIGTDSFSNHQWYALEKLILELKQQYPDAKVIGHNEVSSKTCPGFNVQDWLNEAFK